MTDRTPDRPRVLAIFIAGVASATGFFVITRSGLAGTLAGAAVASMIYTGAAHGVGVAVDRGAVWWIERRRERLAESGSIQDGPSEASDARGGSTETIGVGGDEGSGLTVAVGPSLAGSLGATATAPAGDRRRTGRVIATWGPPVLAVLALAVSAFSVATGTPLETVVVRERVVERPVVKERVVVEQSTVTVTVPVVVAATPSGDSSVGTTLPPVSTASTEPPPSPTTTSLGGTTPSTEGPASVTTSTTPATTPTTTPAPGP